MAIGSIRDIPEPSIKFHWRDLIALDIRDPELRSRAESFLNLFEHSAFRYEKLDERTGRLMAREISGQDYLKRISELKDTYDTVNLSTLLTSRGMMPGGKFLIAQHDRPYDGSMETGAETLWMGKHKPDPLPIGIEIGASYLRAERVSIDAVLVRELTKLAFQKNDEAPGMEAADVIVSVLRGHRTRAFDFNDQSAPYVSYADKHGKTRDELEFQRSGRELGGRTAPESLIVATHEPVTPAT
jgi:hypothetical protein